MLALGGNLHRLAVFSSGSVVKVQVIRELSKKDGGTNRKALSTEPRTSKVKR